MSDQVQEAASRVSPDSQRLADLHINEESGAGPGSSHSGSQKPGELGASPISPDYLVKLAEKATEITHEVEKKQGGPSSPSFHAPQTPPSFNGRPGGPRADKLSMNLRMDAQGREWSPEDVLMVSGKANLLPLLSGGLYNISKRAARRFNKLREIAGDELAILVAQRPETVIIIANKEAEDSGGVLRPRGANGVTAWAQAAVDVLKEVELAAPFAEKLFHRPSERPIGSTVSVGA